MLEAGVSQHERPDLAPSLPSYPVAGTLLAFDFGERFIGVAVGDASLRVAHPLETIDAVANIDRFRRIASLVQHWQPVLLVVGLPLGSEGEEHDTTRRARRFARQLEGRFALPVALADERWTSAEAQSRLAASGRGGQQHKALNHPLAAQIILQSYFDEQGLG